MALLPVAGSKLFIGGQLDDQAADFVATDYDTQVWVEVDGWETMGPVGDSSAVITTALINRGRDVKQKGTRNAGSMENTFAIISDDAGQIAMRAAQATNRNYAFKIEWDDVITTTPTTKLFIGLVMGESEAGGDANTVLMFNPAIEVNSNVITVPAT